MQIQLWEETIEWRDALDRLRTAGLDDAVTRRLSEQLAIERAFREYHLMTPMDGKARDALLARHLQNLPPERRDAESGPEAREALMKALILGERMKSLKAHVIPDPMIREAFINFKAQRETVIFQCMRLSGEPLARELYYRLQHDHADFHHLARQYGEGAGADEGGLNGPIPIGRLKPELRQRLQSLQSGECAAPFLMEPGVWMILRLLRRENLLLSEEIGEKIRDDLFAVWLEQQVHSARALPEALRKSRAAQGGLSLPGSARS